MTTSTADTEQARQWYVRSVYPIELMNRLVRGGRGATGRRGAMLQLVAPPTPTPAASTATAKKKNKNIMRALRFDDPRAIVASYDGLVGLLAGDGVTALHLAARIVESRPIAASHKIIVWEERETVIDLDVHDWPFRASLCICAADKRVCHTCWLLIELAAAVCRELVSDACALGPMLAVFSGNKGCHFWWGSVRARQLDANERDRLVGVVLAYPDASRVTDPCYARALSVLYAEWVRRGIDARALLAKSDSRLACFLRGHAPPRFVWPLDNPTKPLSPRALSVRRWRAFEKAVGAARAQRIITEQCWPRVDGNVTKGAVHHVKAPFSVHASSGRIALPLTDVTQCNPTTMPTIAQVRASLTQQQPPPVEWTSGVQALRTWLDACAY